MTLIVFLGVVVSLLILRLIPGLLLRLLLAVPRQRVAATMRLVRGWRIGFVSLRQSANVLTGASTTSRRAPAVGRLKLVLLSSSLLVLAVLATTAFWTWHSTALMMLLR
jgi:hypothetical protein